MERFKFSLSLNRSTKSLSTVTLGLLVATLLGLSLRLYALGEESLWMDEISQVSLYPLSFSNVIIESTKIAQPPLDGLIGAFMNRLHLTQNDWLVRIPAVIFGCGGVFLLGWWISRIVSPIAGITASFLLAICPLHVYMSQEARPYAALFFLSMACVMMFEWTRKKHTVLSWSLFTVVLTSMLMTRWIAPHFISLSLVIYTTVVWIKSFNKENTFLRRAETIKLWATATCFGIAYALYNPIFGIIFTNMRRAITTRDNGVFPSAMEHLTQSFQSIIYGYSTRTVFDALPGNPVMLALICIVFMIGLVSLFQTVWKKHNSKTILFFITFLPLPILYSLLYAKFSKAPAKPQYLLLMAIPVIACIAIAADYLRLRTIRSGRNLSWFLFIAIIGVVGFPMANATINSLVTLDKRDWRGVLSYLSDNSRPTDAFACIGPDMITPVYFPTIYGQGRYGPKGVKFLRTTMDTNIEELRNSPWDSTDNTVWIVGYNDIMFQGEDKIPTPTDIPQNAGVQSFNDLFLLEIRGDDTAADRLMDGIASIYHGLPEGRSLIAPSVLRGWYYLDQGNLEEAQRSFQLAVKQCPDEAEKQKLILDYLPEEFSTSGKITHQSKNSKNRKARLVKEKNRR